MELRQLKYFTKVAEVGNFRRAAAALGMAQPALSKHIAALEAELGMTLLVRNGRGAVLSDAGIKFLTRAKAILDDVERALQEARSLQGRPMGLVCIGMAPAIGTILAVPLVERVRTLYPEVQLQLTEGYSGHLHEWLLAGQIDLGVLYGDERSIGISCDGLLSESLYLVGAPATVDSHFGPAETVEFARMAKIPLILPARQHAIRKLMDDISARQQFEIQVSLEVNGFSAICHLVASGHGMTILPVSAVLPQIHSGTLKALRIVSPELTQSVGLMTSTHHPTSLATKTISTAIKQLARELVASGQWPERQK